MTSPLVGRRASIVDAEHTLKLAVSAYRRGDKRLSISRAITAAVQAATASLRGPAEVVERADKVIQAVRRLIQGIVVGGALSGTLGARSRTPRHRRGLTYRGPALPRTESEKPWVRAKAMVSQWGPYKTLAASIREKYETQKPDLTEQIRQTFLSVPGSLPVTAERFTLPSGSIRTEEFESLRPGYPWFIPSENRIDLWSRLSEDVPQQALLSVGNGVLVAPEAVPAAVLSVTKMSFRPVPGLIDPAASVAALNTFHKLVETEFERRKKAALEELLLTQVARHLRTTVDEAVKLREEARQEREEEQKNYMLTRGFKKLQEELPPPPVSKEAEKENE